MNLTENLNKSPKNVNNKFTWFINSSEIAPGASAIIGDNRLAFFAIHHGGLCTITVSLVASLIVITDIHKKWKKSTSKLDFPIRFPLYLAIADTLWGLSHFVDHMYLVTVQYYPSNYSVSKVLSINLWFFFGYQQLMHASIAGYTYLRVVHRKRLNLGKWEWKLHLTWFCFLLSTIILFGLLDSFGNTGYWMAYNVTTINGQILGVVIALTSTFNACCTTLGYYRIKRIVVTLKTNLGAYKATATTGDGKTTPSSSSTGHQSIASKCLTTFVWVASCIYCPLAILLWINLLLQIFMGVVEPLSCFLIAIVANCSGWANTFAYFRNERMKQKRERGIQISSTAANSTDRSYHSNSSGL